MLDLVHLLVSHMLFVEGVYGRWWKMKKWVSLSVLGVFVSFIGLIVIAFAQLTQALQSDIFDIEEIEEDLF